MEQKLDLEGKFKQQVVGRLGLKLQEKKFSLSCFERDFIKSKFISLEKSLKKSLAEDERKSDLEDDTKSEFIKVNLILASRFHLSTPAIEYVLEKVLEKKITFDRITFTKNFYTPELIPQQFFLFIKEKLGEADPIEDRRDQQVSVTFLTNNVVGFRFQDCTHYGFIPE